MKATYQHSWLWFLIAILMVPTAYGQMRQFWGTFFMNGNTGGWIMKFRFLVWMMVLGLMSVPSVKAAHTVQIVVGESGPGLTPQVIPFSAPLDESIRYQQVYDSSAFGPIPLRIFRLAFRPTRTIPFSTVIPDIQINLSTTTRAVDGLSGTFADNVGADDTIVLNRGSLAYSGSATGGIFDTIIDLDTPFVYDPAQGNLLLDISLFTMGLCCPFLDGATRSGDPISRVWAFDVASDTSDFDDSVGLVTQFTVSVVGTVLLANFMNGNNADLNSRIYLWNPSGGAGNVSVRVFTLERTGFSTLLGMVDLGSLEGSSARNIKLAEDILTPLEIPLPYTDDGGNLTLEFTVHPASVKGAAQVFSSSLAFGTYPLQEVPSTFRGTTVLVANFMNGNNDVLNSCVYLWNPSTSAGEVTVRVFTLPLIGGTTQELTGTPLSLRTLFAKRALNVNLAEDILAPLGIPLPYTDDGGNLTLEFTIQAPKVRGSAQVFSSDFAFGNYLLQEIPATSAGSPTVLVANFINGNDDALNSRVYLYNPSASDGAVTVRVFTLPLRGDPAPELTTAPLDLGTLRARSALNIKVAEDILDPLERRPYKDDGGNLTLEFTIEAADVRGTAQVFSSDFAFGTYPLQEISATSAGSPTMLVASFMNGNNAAFNSRIYLWNPSESAGAVTVRVFTLPLAGGLAQELTTAPLSLGTLGAKSALNVKLAEDILALLGITPPYTTDGGNLTLEFTIQAPDVRGAAQVFSDSFAFGTYPMQVIQ